MIAAVLEGSSFLLWFCLELGFRRLVLLPLPLLLLLHVLIELLTTTLREDVHLSRIKGWFIH